jgi:hypothetical protein
MALLAGAFAHAKPTRCRVRRGVSVRDSANKFRERVLQRRIQAALGIGDGVEDECQRTTQMRKIKAQVVEQLAQAVEDHAKNGGVGF